MFMKSPFKWSIEKKILASFIVVVVILFSILTIAYGNVSDLIESSRQMARSQQIMAQIGDVQTTLVDAETGQRGFIVTGDEAFLEPYNNATPLIDDQLLKLRELTSSDSFQQGKLTALETPVKDKLTEMQFVIDVRRAQGLEAASRRVSEGLGKNLMDDIRQILGEMETHENEGLAQRATASEAIVRRTRTWFFVLLVVVIVILTSGYFMIRRDNRARARAEEAVRALNADLERRISERTQELEESNKELIRSNEELQQFAYVASHDLQEPLRMVASYTQLLSRRYKGKLDEDADDFIGFAVDGANRMQVLINDLLAYSRVGTKGKPLAPTNSNESLELALANLYMTIQESGAVIEHDELPMIMADGTQISQLFQNLIGNGIKFRGKEPPRIKITCKKQGKEWLFSLKDNGIGIDPQYVERVFIIFQRLHTRDEYPGTGIGLAICKKVVERHGGRIWVESTPGEGSTFYFTLPFMRLDKGVAPEIEQPANGNGTGNGTGNGIVPNPRATKKKQEMHKT